MGVRCRLCAVALLSMSLSSFGNEAESGYALTVTPAPSDDASVVNFHLALPNQNTPPWHEGAALRIEVDVAADVPGRLQLLAYVKDHEYLWHQYLVPEELEAGTTAIRTAPLVDSLEWTPEGHRGAFQLQTLVMPKEVGVRIFSADGACIANTVFAPTVALMPRAPDTTPPAIRNIRWNRLELPRFEKLEINFELPDRYDNPFDPEVIDAFATVSAPDGSEFKVPAFFDQPHEELQPGTNYPLPVGRAHWTLRYTPSVEGRHTLRLTARDRFGEATSDLIAFNALPGKRRGFVRVSERDPRRFELTDGTFYFPIGHNIRCPFDLRMHTRFPWRERWRENYRAYERYLADMARNGQNFVEIWSASWSLGLEWLAEWPGYRGIGRYNLRNAWMMDRVLEMAERNGVFVNYVVHNHGKFSTYCDQEWTHNPFNRANGGYLDSPEEYFTNERAKRHFAQLMRYTIARFGYSTAIFAWELWNEVDLTGAAHNFYRKQEVVDWHAWAGDLVRAIDPYDHLIATHYAGDHTRPNEDICRLPQFDIIPMNAYHGSADPLHIVEMLSVSARKFNPFNKPVLIAEFGGSPWGQSVSHLREELHAGLWSSAGTPLGGAPMFWWWQLVEEEDFYGIFHAFARFMDGEDLRDPALLPQQPTFVTPGAHIVMKAQCLASPHYAIGWAYNAVGYISTSPTGTPTVTNVVMTLAGFAPGDYRVEFFDTGTGLIVAEHVQTLAEGGMAVPFPPFARDIAFKIKPWKGIYAE